MRLLGKVALITGGNSGIGLATAKRFVREGAKVVVTGRNPDTLAATAKELGTNALVIAAEVDDAKAIAEAARAAVGKFGRLDIVFANAGIGGLTPVGDTPLEGFEKIVRTNFTSVFFTVQAALPHLGKGGSVILNGSVHEVLGAPGYSAYAGTKAAVRAMTRVLASELGPRGIRVNVVVPGATRTPIWDSRGAAALAAMEERLAQSIPNGRMSEADETANAVLFLASDEASAITGAELVVDGGHTSSPGFGMTTGVARA